MVSVFHMSVAQWSVSSTCLSCVSLWCRCFNEHHLWLNKVLMGQLCCLPPPPPLWLDIMLTGSDWFSQKPKRFAKCLVQRPSLLRKCCENTHRFTYDPLCYQSTSVFEKPTCAPTSAFSVSYRETAPFLPFGSAGPLSL